MRLKSITYRFIDRSKEYSITLYENGDAYFYEIQIDGVMHSGSLGQLVFPTVDNVRRVIAKLKR